MEAKSIILPEAVFLYTNVGVQQLKQSCIVYDRYRLKLTKDFRIRGLHAAGVGDIIRAEVVTYTTENEKHYVSELRVVNITKTYTTE